MKTVVFDLSAEYMYVVAVQKEALIRGIEVF